MGAELKFYFQVDFVLLYITLISKAKMMFGSDILEVAIGMVFLYLFMSMIASALREAFEAFLQQRAVLLERGITEMLRGQGAAAVENFYNHPIISSLYRGDYTNKSCCIIDIPPRLASLLDFVFGSTKVLDILPKRSLLPAYIPKENFSLAVLDIIAGASEVGQKLSFAGLEQTLLAAKAQGALNTVQRVVLMGIATTDNDLAAVRKYLEDWYDATMQRVTGWYTRRSAVFLFVFGLGAAVAINVDSITIAKSLIVDRPLRQAIVAQAEKYAQNQSNHAPSPPAEKPTAAPAAPPVAIPAGDPVKPKLPGAKEAGAKPAAHSAGGDAPLKSISDAQRNFEDLRTEFAQIGYPIGWASEDGWWYPAPQGCQRTAKGKGDTDIKCGEVGSYAGMWLLAIMGWLITAIAIMLGAPFWFDLLNKLVSLRSALKPQEEKPGSKRAKTAPAS